jgi:hypothetical protein
MDKLSLIVVATLETIVICLLCIHSVSIVERMLYLFDSRKKHMYWWRQLMEVLPSAKRYRCG